LKNTGDDIASNFITKNTPSLERLAVAASSQDADINVAFERMKAELRDSLGMISPQAAVELADQGIVLPVAQPAVMPESSSAPQNCTRVVYPHGNDRFEIYAATEEELDRKEAALRALYQ
jgi:hypothetical protein